MSARIFLVLAGLLAVNVISLAAQGTPPPPTAEPLLDDWRWTPFSTTDGLPSPDVYAFAEDLGGIEWVLTSEGLAWFDDFSWHSLDQSAGIPTEGLSDLQPDSRGGVVVVADGRVYRGDVNGFAPVTVEHDGRPLQILNVAPWSEELLLVSTPGGLFHVSDGATVPDARFGSTLRLNLSYDGGRAWVISAGELLEWNGRSWESLVAAMSSTVQAFVVGSESEAAFLVYGTNTSGAWLIDDRHVARLRAGSAAGSLLARGAMAPSGDLVLVHGTETIEVMRAGIWSTQRARAYASPEAELRASHQVSTANE